ncbi:hypothetical protein [uncultured Rhodoblastus sp.]|uniref:hypothetical protein n=1 Tax=uncultured Rhodoblastus sp. TaxID=543037 RepID=UPI0025DC0B33|nr:hypothetical protein [uncultured Rhodoblastus sp.]
MEKLLCGALALASLTFVPAQASAMSYFTGPAASTNVANAARTAEAVACVVANSASVALSVEDAINQGKATQIVRSGATTTVRAASLEVCRQLGGIAGAPSAPASSY